MLRLNTCFLLPGPVAVLDLLPHTQELALVCWQELETTDVLEQQKVITKREGGGDEDKPPTWLFRLVGTLVPGVWR